MKTLLTITQLNGGATPEFRLSSASGESFVVKSILVVDSERTPLWEFVRESYETTDELEIATQIVDVMTDDFRQALRDLSGEAAIQPAALAAVEHDVRYGTVPRGYKQSIPHNEVPILSSQAAYRLVVFSSVGSANLVFRCDVHEPSTSGGPA